MSEQRIAILGTVGVPANYGGFETLAQNLVDYHGGAALSSNLVVYCSSKAFKSKPEAYGTARLRYIGLDANGPQSILYDVLSLLDAIRRRDTQLLLLGVSGALALPFVRLLSRARIITNIDGIEWKREKWKPLARAILRVSEWSAVRFSHRVVTDNQAIADYVTLTHCRPCEFIPYGGDHALSAEPEPAATAGLPENYALALCRIEPENNVAMILEAFAELGALLVFVGNWEKSDYGRALKSGYMQYSNIIILDPIYEPHELRAIRDRASMYVHGHSAGGTNPSLVEMMHFGIPVVAHGCIFNRHTTENKARYFEKSAELVQEIRAVKPQDAIAIGAEMLEIAKRRYTWDDVGKAYFALLESVCA
jgi:glycosyltransferase involved in cell wall biosynthesis